jgi:hypothetical protein
MSIIRDYEAEKEFALLKWLGEAIQDLERLLEPPGAATAVTSTPQDEPLAKPETAGLGRPFEDVQ